ncbi:stage III sporulation protein AF [Clostridium niameyense]|uniref:Stage III sporulation protein AF n=1 Tax=Clostridium niameyense TaxID=1622073 RepID=A0A6M0RAR0_9CLOT|nr:stage III sporulation protein AF [Clostridium niameyense]NEZ46308.1 stage III sporulation protein AF [Clostridium niameyense]
MLLWIKNWITNICVAVLFITAIEMILPNNSIKKYAKFVLGLILMMVILNPIIKLFHNDYDMAMYAQKASHSLEKIDYQKDFEDYKKKNNEETLKNFKMNLNNETKKKLEQKFPKNKYKVDTKVDYNYEKNTIEIKSMKIGVKDSKVEKVKKVNISKNIKDGQEKECKGEEKIKDFIIKEFEISSNKIKVYKL